MSAPTAHLDADFFVLRAPLLPFDAWAEPAGSGRSRLSRLLALPAVRDAVYLASPSLHAQVDEYLREPDSRAGRKAEHALARYGVRMAGRATPFGLFAGCSVGTIGRDTRLRVGGTCRRHTRLDMDYVATLAEALAADPDLRPALRFMPNSSLHRFDGWARYREVRRQDQRWTHHRAVIRVPDYLDAVLARAAGGATVLELADALLERDPEATAAEARDYVTVLIEHQVLVSELAPAVIGSEPVHRLIERLRELPAGAAWAEQLAWVRDELAAVDAGGPGADPGRYAAIAERLADLPGELDAARFLQVDLVRPSAEATLGRNVVDEMRRGVELLRRLTPRPAHDPLADFRRAFTARFGDTPVTREVPLCEALDEETGIGFGGGEAAEASSLLDGLDLEDAPERHTPWGPREAYLLGRLTEVLQGGADELWLNDADLEHLSVTDPPPLPDAFAVLARLEADSGEAASDGDFRLLVASVVGPSGARVLGRFCHADPELHECVAQHLRAEEELRPDAVFAEVAHLPEGRVGNILLRPPCRSYEIPYLARSAAPAARQLPLDDLTVSVDGERIVQRSARLGREVLPRLTSAHDFGRGQGVYRFLCALQGQGVASGLAWDWGPLAASAYLPRVVCGRLVLARAQWNVTAAEIERLLQGGEGDRFAAVQRWREARRLPRWVCVVDHDNELPIDLDDRLMVDTMLGQMRGRAPVTINELFPSPDRLCARGDDGRYVHELVVPFLGRPTAELPGHRQNGSARSQPRQIAAPKPQRLFPPGSEWLSLKVYGGPLAIDRLVRDVVGPLATRLLAAGGARQWFFVRYADPHHHVRVRFAGAADRLWADVLPAVQAAVSPLLASGRVWRVQLDSYEREVERYGGESGIEVCEQIFHHDTMAAVELLGTWSEDGRDDLRWRLALLGMARLLDDLGFDLSAKEHLARRARDAMRRELAVDAEAAARVGAKYRTESSALAALLGRAPGPGTARDAARAVFDRRSAALLPLASALRHSALEGSLTLPLQAIAQSLLHMHANRLLRSSHRLQELVLYDFLTRVYRGEIARG